MSLASSRLREQTNGSFAFPLADAGTGLEGSYRRLLRTREAYPELAEAFLRALIGFQMPSQFQRSAAILCA